MQLYTLEVSLGEVRRLNSKAKANKMLFFPVASLQMLFHKIVGRKCTESLLRDLSQMPCYGLLVIGFVVFLLRSGSRN